LKWKGGFGRNLCWINKLVLYGAGASAAKGLAQASERGLTPALSQRERAGVRPLQPRAGTVLF